MFLTRLDHWRYGLLASFLFIHLSANSFAQEIHIAHCPKGCPIGSPPTNDLVISHIYALSSNGTRKFADWVAYVVTPDTIGTSSSLIRAWKPDPNLTDEETLEPNDYRAANQVLGVDRGHQAPLASFSGTIFWRETNFLSNITPQKSDLNQGPWKELESSVRHAAIHVGDVFVITGPLYDGTPISDLPNADEPHKVPTGYWKIVANSGGDVSSFIFEQDTDRSANFCDFLQPIDTVEVRSRLSFFPNAPDWPKGTFDHELGC